jgi:hypothetical protein
VPAVVQAPVLSASLGRSVSGLDLLDVSGIPGLGNASCDLGVQLMNTLHMEDEVLSEAWV